MREVNNGPKKPPRFAVTFPAYIHTNARWINQPDLASAILAQAGESARIRGFEFDDWCAAPSEPKAKSCSRIQVIASEIAVP
jgi:hypothetical protein